jgi:hypothetical protein
MKYHPYVVSIRPRFSIRLTLVMVWIVCSVTLAPAEEPTPKTPPEHPWEEVLVQPDLMCIQWTDDCRACARSDVGVITCSNVAIVCPAERIVRCLKREEPKPSQK